MSSGPRSVQIFGQHYSGYVCWGCFWMRITFEWVDWIKQIAICKVGRPYPITAEVLNRTKRLTLSVVRRYSSYLTVEVVYQVFPNSGVVLKHQLLLGLQRADHRFGTSQPVILVNQFFIINLYIHISFRFWRNLSSTFVFWRQMPLSHQLSFL